MDEVEIEVVCAEFLERLVQGGFDVFGGVEFVPKLYAREVSIHSHSDLREDLDEQLTLEVIHRSFLDTPLSLIACPTSASFP